MTQYKIKEGRNNFRPFELPFPCFKPKGFQIEFAFDVSCYYPVEEWEGDRDWEDMNKLAGLTRFFTLNNYQSVMISWCPSPILNRILVAPYVNYPHKEFTIGPAVEVVCGKKYSAKCLLTADYEAQFHIIGEDKTLSYATNFDRYTLMRRVGTSIGGANNSPGKYGGYSTRDMNLWLHFKTL